MEPAADLASAAEPRYRQLAGLFRARITGGDIASGARLPSLREQRHVSRVTAERAIDLLWHEGLVSGVTGVGTFAAQPARKRARVRTTP